MTAEVIVDIAHSEVDRIFEYRAVDGVEEGCRVKVPFGNRTVDGFVMRLKEGSDYDSSKLKSIERVVDRALTPECLSLVRGISERYRCSKALTLRLFLPGEMRKGAVHELYKTYAVLEDANAPVPARARAQAAALGFLCENPRFGYTELCEKFGRGAVNALAEKGAISLVKERVTRSPYGGVSGESAARTLTPAQEEALRRIGASTRRVQLLHGVTGSGKTEIYLSLIAKTLQEGKSALFLVP